MSPHNDIACCLCYCRYISNGESCSRHTSPTKPGPGRAPCASVLSRITPHGVSRQNRSNAKPDDTTERWRTGSREDAIWSSNRAVHLLLLVHLRNPYCPGTQKPQSDRMNSPSACCFSSSKRPPVVTDPPGPITTDRLLSFPEPAPKSGAGTLLNGTADERSTLRPSSPVSPFVVA
jgi:hypothetical protein